ncbi:MAG: Cytochrome c551/c552 [uncultured Arthrobacter sp.]|uniref:Cytochrome c551/c552 n=1 Tax=uncultured Arthrobacter sp. TaxID=114050 RepID=A0A6J4JBA8_9MICC|nr:MAG: Cytochrome c551/c552 [uncultured Arthrobacter sp.]
MDEASEEILIDNIRSPNGNHNGGDLHFGSDGNLYVSVGDGGCDYAEKTRCQYENDASRDRHVLLGKILRITPDGSIPEGNPYTGPDSARCNTNGSTPSANNCQETYASGFRNPFRFAIDPDAAGAPKLFVNDVGGQRWEEVDNVRAGEDYGWNICEGHADNPYRAGSTDCDGAQLTGPIHQYNHNTGCESVTAGTFVPDGTNWPAKYKDAYLFGDFVCGKMFSLTPKSGGDFEKEIFAGGLRLRSPVAMDFGPYKNGQALYYATFEDGGMIRRIAFTDGPSAEVETVGNNYGPLTMAFDASKSTTPSSNEIVEYVWDFGDGKPRETTSDPAVGHTYDQRGKYTATVTVRDSAGNVSDPAKIDVFPGDEPPAPTIDGLTEAQIQPAEAQAQAEADAFRVGADYTATGSATDPDGDAPVEMTWEVVQRHDNNHEHPLENATGGSVSFSGPKPEGLYSTNPDENSVEVRLTATDALGLSKTVIRRLPPRTTELAFKTVPAGLRLNIAGERVSTSQTPTVTSWEGYELNVFAPRQRKDGRIYAFQSWSDGGTAAGRVIETPEEPTEYTATYRKLRR